MYVYFIFWLAEDELRDCILLVLANKQDLPNAWSALKMSEQLQLHKLGTRVVWSEWRLLFVKTLYGYP